MSNELILAISGNDILVGRSSQTLQLIRLTTAWLCGGDLFDRYDRARF